MNLDRFRERLSKDDPAIERIGRYEILRQIGEGGMAIVYQAHDAELDRLVAVKVLRHGSAERLRQEASAAAQLRHPHIVTVYEIGPDYIVMEYVEGRTLAQALPELSQDQKIRALVTVARAVDHAHAQDVIHRDLKPGNVLLDSTGRVVLTDFGLARIASGSGVTVGGSMLGTPEYMAPEQVAGETVNRAADVWSLGVILYEMVAGRRPFEGRTAFETYDFVTRRQPEPLDGPLGAVAARALDKSPRRRYPTAGAFADDLERFLRGDQVTARLPRWKRGLGMAAVVALVAVVVTFHRFQLHRPGEAPPPQQPGAASNASVLAGVNQKFRFEEERETEALARNPDDVSRLIKRAGVRTMRAVFGDNLGRDPMADWTAAEADLDRANRLAPDNEEVVYQRGELLARRIAFEVTYGIDPGPRCKSAIDDLSRVAHMTSARMWRGIALFFCARWRLQHGGDARPELLAAEADLTPAGTADAFWRRGRVRIFLDQAAEAEQDFVEAVRLNPEAWPAWMWRGIGRRHVGDLAGAEKHLTRAIQMAQQESEAWEERGNGRLAGGRYAEALADFQQAIAFDSRRAPLLADQIALCRRRGEK